MPTPSRWRAPTLLALFCLSCVSGNKIRADAEVIRADIERARRSGAMRCAPRELATAEANLDFALAELSEGSSFRAGEHIRDAEAATKKALALSRDCGPKQVLVRETTPDKPVIVKIEETDTDADGIFDKDDQCVDQPEDKDGFQDEDGCPEADNDNDGVLDGNDKCPLVPGPLSNQGCPEEAPADRDGDGIPDPLDRCVDQPEDKDGFQDEDGCPDLDNDGDGVPDEKDQCPNEPGVPEENGCPKKYKLVVVKKDRIEIKQQIKFKTNSHQIIGAQSFEILKEVAQALKDNAHIKKVRIEGHTDSVGNDAYNLKLSQRRADSVMAALIKEGIDPARLEAVGFGETRPIASNATKAGRAENRRTEFNIVEQ